MRRILGRVIRPLLRKCGYALVREQRELPSALVVPLDHERDALEYDDIWSHTGFIERYLSEERRQFCSDLCDYIREKTGAGPIASIADIGCGPGFLLSLLAEMSPNARLVGRDLSQEVLKVAREVCTSAEFEVHDIYDEVGQSFDLIVCSEVLEHLDYPGKALAQLTKAAPQIVLTVPNGRTDSYSGHINFWSERSFRVFLEPYTSRWKIDVCLLCGESKIASFMRRRARVVV